MADPPLLLVETDFARIEVRGPYANDRSNALGFTGTILARLNVDAGGAARAVTYRDATGSVCSWSPGHAGPRFYEATRYQLIARAKDASTPPSIVHRDPSLAKDVVAMTGDPIVVWSFDFNEQVGLSDLAIRFGERLVRITIEVFPTKLDYASDYTELLHEVGAAARGLAFEYLRSTYARSGVEATTEQSGVEWLTLVRHHVTALEAALRFIDAHPHRALQRSVDLVRTERIRRVDSVVRSAVMRGAGSGEWMTLPNIGKVRARLPAGRATETLDTPEHRWIRHSLSLVRERLAVILRQLAVEHDQALASGRAPSRRLASERGEVTEIQNRVEHLLELPILRLARSTSVASSTASLTLLAAPGYADAYQRLLALRLGLHVHGDALDLSTKELDVLYETWCFIRIARMLVETIGGRPNFDELLAVDASGIRIRLQRGQQSNIKVAAPGRTLVLSYNRHFAGLTGAQKPDIVLELRHDGWPEIIVVFDAKYRVDTSPAYLSTFVVPGPPADAVNALHRYRDAIVLGAAESPRGRPVVKGVALFPLSSARVEDFRREQPLFRSLDVLGIGALPFLPDCTELVEEWLRALLQLGPEVLAVPGPPWLAHGHSLAHPRATS